MTLKAILKDPAAVRVNILRGNIARPAGLLDISEVQFAVESEPELPGQIPDEMWSAIRNDRDACGEAMRIAVRQTKSGILERVRKLDSDSTSAPVGIESALVLCHRLRDGAARMTRQQFRNCLHRAIGADKDYADGVWVSFQNNPAAFLAHRQPQSQSVELLRVILELTKE